ncbi:DoxX family protein [Brenneria corticis]|uniref:DoxX family protein n=1 Tax=Brenneria corticis TaxID=2173106 RepID=A0A2U1TYR6_9GAMM|nr:DoxX family protein [Brenneria sp. CFCC 11842]PWC14558.1 DoxX family protein [Brenneria sp. CFCC 11842]
MSKISAKQWLAYALVAFFVVGGIGNIIAPQPIADDYARWGYPHWFHLVTGFFELVAAILIVRKASRLVGSIIAIGIMFSAAATVIYHGEYTHAIAPLIVLTLLILSVYLHRK